MTFMPNRKSKQSISKNEINQTKKIIHLDTVLLGFFSMVFLIKVTSASKLHFDLKLQVSRWETSCVQIYLSEYLSDY